MDSTGSSSGTDQQPQPQPNLPPGFRFHPTDEELVVHYLKRKAASAPLPVAIIADVDLYKFDPWELPAKATYGEQEWYFFSPRDRKYPNGARPNRAANSGYWKATGTDKPVLSSGGTQKVGVKKALVFYGGKPPKGIKTNWIMHEYRLADTKTNNNKPPGYDIPNKNSLRLDDWVLCRIYKKNNTHITVDHDKDNDRGYSIPAPRHISHQNARFPLPKPTSFGCWLQNDHNNGILEGMLGHDATISQLGPSSSKAALPLLLGWNEENNPDPSPSKRFHADNCDGSVARIDGNCSSIATLISQLPQTPSMMGSLGDGVLRSPYQLPGMNWFP